MRNPLSSTHRLALAAAATALLTSGCDTRDAYETVFRFSFPHPITLEGKTTFDLWLGSTAAALAVGIFVWALIFWAGFFFRKNSEELPRQVRYNLPIEVLYTVVPFVIIAVLFFYTATGENKINKLTKNPDVTIGVVGFKWNWQFVHANDKVQVTGTPTRRAELVLPINERIRFVETSPDVIHSFYVPAFLFKRDVVPGRTNQFEVTITKPGTYVGRCAEFCGEKHDRMNFTLRAVTPQEYQSYIATLKADPNAVANPNIAAIPTGSN